MAGAREKMSVGFAVLAAFLGFSPGARGDCSVDRVFRPEIHGRGDANVRPQQPIDRASWVWYPGHDVWGGAVFSETRPSMEMLARQQQAFFRLRRDFECCADAPLEFDVSADERFVLLLDGREIARGPNRGLRNRWHYQSYRVRNLSAGTHRLEAVVWQIGEHAPLAQVSVRGGFVLKAYGDYDAELSTGTAVWQIGRLTNTRMTGKGESGAFGVGSQCEVAGTSLLDEEPSGWREAVVVRGPVKYFAGLLTPGWMLFPSPLRDQLHEVKTPGRICRGPDVLSARTVLPARTETVVLWDLENYYCAYPELHVSGGRGTRIAWDWAECLTGTDGKKGNRSVCEGLDMHQPFGDVFRCDGRANARFTTPWWRCGRWCRLSVKTADEPLAIESLSIVETRYPAQMKAVFECDDPLVGRIQPLCARSLEMCLHETFVDCPYYEQQMYPGDTRVQSLVAGLFDVEDRVVRNAMTLFDSDRRENGLVPMNCPTRGLQDALTFSTCEAMMYGDYVWQHANRAWLKARLPGLNHTLMGIATYENAEGLLVRTPGCRFIDWVPGWRLPGGQGCVPPDGNTERPNAEINLQYLQAIRSAAIAEEAVGERGLADYWRTKEMRLSAAIRKAFWDSGRGLFASEVSHREFSEHAQCLALLADVVTGEEAARCFQSLTEAADLARCTVYYQHYLFETFFKFGRADLFFKNLAFWKDCCSWGLSTVLEHSRLDSRSDCHGWGSHPLWHLHTGVAGVRSAAPWFEKVLVAPQPAHLREIRSSTPTPKGDVVLDLRFDGGRVAGTVMLPEGLDGVFRWKNNGMQLKPGINIIANSVLES